MRLHWRSPNPRINFGLKGGQRSRLPILPLLTNRQRTCLGNNANEGQQIGVASVQPNRCRGRNELPRTLDE
jgi:hypothetical protein